MSKIENDSLDLGPRLPTITIHQPHKAGPHFISWYSMDWDGAEARALESKIFARNRSRGYLLVRYAVLMERRMDGKIY